MVQRVNISFFLETIDGYLSSEDVSWEKKSISAIMKS